VLGALEVSRSEAGGFTDDEMAILHTIADQAIIALENARLLNELRETLQQQTATAEVLKTISRSAFDLPKVLDALIESATRLCGADMGMMRRKEGEAYPLAATFGFRPEWHERLARRPSLAGRHSIAGRAMLELRTVYSPDVTQDPEYELSDRQKLIGMRAVLVTPLLRQGHPIGYIAFYKLVPGAFSNKQVELIETFADQAVIAIENARLFEELQSRTKELQQALEYQTATSEVLSVISRSPTELEPVLNAIVRTATTLCLADDGVIFLKEGDYLKVRAHHGPMAMDVDGAPIGRGWVAGRCVLDKIPINVLDLPLEREEFPLGSQMALRLNQRTSLGIPLLRDGQAIGCMFLRRTQVQPFTEEQIAVLQTFADQAVIAIANTRLFEEVQARNRDLTALGDVGRAVSSTLDLKVVLKTIVERAVELSGTDAGSIFYYRDGRFQLGETTGLGYDVIARFRKLDITEGQTGLGEAIANREPLQVHDILERASNPLRDAAVAAGFRAALIVPLLSGDGPLGALVLQRRRLGNFPRSVVSLMQSFADQSAIALENARLFEEIAQKSRELEVASQHKSQFVANMSHELRTPLAAILGYAELMQEGFYEPQGPKSTDALVRICSNGKHLLGLINTVLDIAKIESGQFTLNMSEYAIESVVETVRAATESLAQNKKLLLKTEVAKAIPVGLGDEQRLTQVLLNLVGNAIKFTDAGEVRVSVTAANGHFTVTVTDTGPGIPEEHQMRIFEQFHQVDSSNTKAKAGTGLGLAIAREIVQMHGGRIWVTSRLGKGSTFQMELPVRAEFRKRP
jgi:signal transduction histidine kinase